MSAAPMINAQELKARYRREMRDYDARPAQYKPRWQITDVGEALLLHRELEQRYTETDTDADVDGGDA
ncbi:MAG: hypothetical protein ACYCS8_18365 [Acidithiobacillus sp.]